MAQWSERYKSHPLWQNLQTLGPTIDTAFNREGIDAEALDGLARLKAILTFVGRRLAGADTYLFQVGTIDALSNSLQTIINEVQAFTANGNIGHINNANSHGDIAYEAFLPVVKAEFSWPSFAGRVFVALTVGALAAYAGTQADRYQKMERYNRRLALELEAIGPYIAPLSEEKQADFRVKVGERSFGQGEGLHSDLDSKSPTTVADVIADPKLRAFIIDIIKATKP